MATNSNGQPSQPQMVGDGHYRCEVFVINEMGLHARPASAFVELANQFNSDVAIQKGGEAVDGKSILQLLSLSAEAGTPLVLEARGQDAEAAVLALANLVASGFNEMGPAGH